MRLPDALMFRYAQNGTIAHTVVEGHEMIASFERNGWRVLVHSSDVRYADLEDVRQLDIARFSDWKSSWERGM
jgi:hypothetical protein